MVVTLAYFGYLAAMAMARRRPKPLIGSLLMLSWVFFVGMGGVLPALYLLAGYWLPALLVVAPNAPLERRLLIFDHSLFGPKGLDAFASKAPRLLIEYFELAYLLCYAVVPVGFGWLVFAGFQDRAGMFWSTVLLASFSCYGLLPLLPTRAPRAVQPPLPRRPSVIRHLNHLVLDRASVQWNTFPSGHTAASVATALAVGSLSPVAGMAFGVVALSIAIGSVVGRYHYLADAIAGALFAVAAFVTASAAHAP